jgi:uncharacterized protein (TIGR03435 family)
MRTTHLTRRVASPAHFAATWHFAATCMIGCLTAVPGWAQSQNSTPPAASEFDVASVKQLDQSLPPGQYDLSFVGTSGKPFKISGNRVTVGGTLRALIADAYGIKDYQISGTPAWAGNLVFTVTAKTPDDAVPSQEQVRPMLQALLADRFQLKLHRETKELPVYHLIQAKKSTLFRPAGPDETFSWNLTPGPGGTLRSKATKESIGDFVQLTGVSADRPVIDKTGLTGDIDYEILINQQEARTQDDVNRAILDAIKDQLGMKLEPAKDPIELLVVERVEKPSEN